MGCFFLTIQINLLSSSDSDNRSDSQLPAQKAAMFRVGIWPHLMLRRQMEIKALFSMY